MSGEEGVKIPLNVVINRQQDRVLLAEADSYFVDILVSFLTLPLGKILRLFKNHYGDSAPAIGSLTSLYTSLQNLDDAHFCSSEGKQMLLNSRSTFSDDCRELRLNLDDSQPTIYYVCEGTRCDNRKDLLDRYIDFNHGVRIYTSEGKCQSCWESLKKLQIRPEYTIIHGEVFMKRDAYSFAVSDDMQLRCVASGSILKSFRSFGITDIHGVKQRTLQLGLNEMMDLLKGLLISQTPLTSLFLNEQHMTSHRPAESDLGSSLDHVDKQKESNTNTVVLKVMLQKSTGKLLFAQAGDDFVDFLLSLFTIPLGGVAYLLNGCTNLVGLDNLYKSVSSFDSALFTKSDVKTQLVQPSLPIQYFSERQILPISETRYLPYYHYPSRKFVYKSFKGSVHIPCLPQNPKGGSCYLKTMGMFMVMDDLTVRRLSSLSTLSFFDVQGVSLSDVEEVDVEIGLKEGLRILKASLTSSNAVITNALIIPGLLTKKKPKQEPMV